MVHYFPVRGGVWRKGKSRDKDWNLKSLCKEWNRYSSLELFLMRCFLSHGFQSEVYARNTSSKNSPNYWWVPNRVSVGSYAQSYRDPNGVSVGAQGISLNWTARLRLMNHFHLPMGQNGLRLFLPRETTRNQKVATRLVSNSNLISSSTYKF